MRIRLAIVLCVGCLVVGNGMTASTNVITPRWGHTVTALADGRLLVAGGEDGNGLVAAIEILDPVTPQTVGTDTLGTLSSPRRRHTAVRLDDGRVLLAGGEGASGILDTAELIDPVTGTVTEVEMGTPRADHTATLLANGTVLLAGGTDGTNSLASLQIFNPATNALTAGADLAEPRHRHTATLLDDGRVLFVGGRNESAALATSEYWSQTTGMISTGPTLSEARFAHSATRIRGGGVAIAGGSGGNAPLASVEVFGSDANSFIPAGSLGVAREGHTAVVLPNNGHLMILGGRSADGPVAAVELLHPYQQSFVFQPPLDPARADFVAAIAGPYVWAVGGRSSAGEALGSFNAVPFSTLASDRTEYPPNTTVTLRGHFWLPGENVTIEIISSHEEPATTVASLADANGTFVNTEFSTGNDGGGFYVATASGAQSGRTAAVELGRLIPTSFGAFSLTPSTITQTTDPVTVTITGGFHDLTVVGQGDYCKGHFIGCLARVYWTRYSKQNRVGVSGTRDDTNINVELQPIALSPNRLDALLPTIVTSTVDHYRVRVLKQLKYVETTNWVGFIPGSTTIDNRDELSAPFGPLIVSPPDFTPPVVALTIGGSSGPNGWYTDNVFVTWSVSDPESPISSTSGCVESSVEDDTTGRTFTCTATSGGGTTTESVTIKRDASPPDATLSIVDGTQGSNGWYVSPVTIRTSGSDTVSAPVTCSADRVQSADTTGTPFSGSCTNGANLTQTTAPILIKLDKTAPTITAAATTAPNAAGWYQGDVTVRFTCMDATSGIATCPADQTLSGEGASIASTPKVAVDAAGNASNPSNVVTVKIDRTPPQVSLNGGPAHGGSYYFGEVPATPSCAGSDGLSGLAACALTGYGTAVGTHTVLATATDAAGNTSVQSATYTVLPWTFAGFYQPVEMGDVVNSVKGGSTVAITFEAFAGPTELVDLAVVVQPLKATQALCGSAEVNDIALLATGDTSLRYDAATGRFIYNWKTPKMPGYCYMVTVTLKDGTSQSAQFRLK